MKFSTALYNLARSKTPESIKSKIDVAYSKFDPVLINFYRMTTGWDKPIPPFSLRKLTAKRSLDHYVNSGQNIVKSLIDGLQSSTAKDIDDFQDVLDFGCGAGRQVQYFYDRANVKLTGCDPSQPHIQWLSENYPSANFYVSKFAPPLPFSNASFDLVYSVSVFTHLSEKAQFEWLSELRRILRPGGIALLTIMGEYAAQLSDRNKYYKRDPNEPKSFSQELSEKKFLFYVPTSYSLINSIVSPNSVSEDEMYGATWHSKEYITNKWSQYFNIVNIIPGCIDNLQDLVVLRKENA